MPSPWLGPEIAFCPVPARRAEERSRSASRRSLRDGHGTPLLDLPLLGSLLPGDDVSWKVLVSLAQHRRRSSWSQDIADATCSLRLRITTAAIARGALGQPRCTASKRALQHRVNGQADAGGPGLTDVDEPAVEERVRKGRLQIVLEAYGPTVPGFFLYFPRSSRTSPPLRALVDIARELLSSPR